MNEPPNDAEKASGCPPEPQAIVKPMCSAHPDRRSVAKIGNTECCISCYARLTHKIVTVPEYDEDDDGGE